MKENNMFEHDPETMHLGAVIFSENSTSDHFKMTDQEWEAYQAELAEAHDARYSDEAMWARVQKVIRSYDDMKREWEEKDGLVGRGNLYLPEGVTRGYDVTVHGPIEFIN